MGALVRETAHLIGVGLLVTLCGGCAPEESTPTVSATRRPSATPAEIPEIFSIELTGQPESTYRTDRTSDVMSPLEDRVRSRFPNLVVDRCLERAAGAHLEVPPHLVDRMPLAFSEFALHWAGCPDPSATVGILKSDETDDAVLIDYIGQLMEEETYSHVGVARDTAQAPYRTRWVVLLVGRRFSLRSAPSSGDPGANLALQFRVDAQFTRAAIVVTDPGGSTRTIDTGLSDGWAIAGVPLSTRKGRQWVELIGYGPSGPQVLALFPVAVGRPPPRAWVGRIRPDESWIKTVDQAETFAAELIQLARDRFDLQRVERDPRLDAVARRHSTDMATSGYFAHVSPTTGSVVDRLRSEGYTAVFAAENIAMGASLTEAQESLMRSPGHRAAILTADATHFGVGVASVRTESFGEMHLLTQVFVTEPRRHDGDRRHKAKP